MQARVEAEEDDVLDTYAPPRICLGDVASFSGEELFLRFGAAAPQQLVDLIVIAIRKGDDDEVAAIDGRLREIERLGTRRG